MNILGLMSGSSLDGIDLALVSITENNGKINWNLLQSKGLQYSEEWINKLKEIHNYSAYDFHKCHIDYGHYLGKKIRGIIEKDKWKVDLIASHGHTVFHDPSKQLTCQIGDGAAICKETNTVTITDFRSTDIAYGGQGAPLAPLVELHCFPEYTVFLNLGGICNISINNKKQLQSFDIAPCNQLLNYWANRIDKLYDHDGLIAREGKLIPGLMEKLNAWEFYNKPSPKSLSNQQIQDYFFTLFNDYSEIEDCMLTSALHIVHQINKSLLQKVDLNDEIEIYCTGGGTHNKFLFQELNKLNKRWEFIKPKKEIIDFKEALLMSLAGYFSFHKKPIFFSSVTGAKKDVTGGALYNP